MENMEERPLCEPSRALLERFNCACACASATLCLLMTNLSSMEWEQISGDRKFIDWMGCPLGKLGMWSCVGVCAYMRDALVRSQRGEVPAPVDLANDEAKMDAVLPPGTAYGIEDSKLSLPYPPVEKKDECETELVRLTRGLSPPGALAGIRPNTDPSKDRRLVGSRGEPSKPPLTTTGPLEWGIRDVSVGEPTDTSSARAFSAGNCTLMGTGTFRAVLTGELSNETSGYSGIGDFMSGEFTAIAFRPRMLPPLRSLVNVLTGCRRGVGVGAGIWLIVKLLERGSGESDARELQRKTTITAWFLGAGGYEFCENAPRRCTTP